MFLALAWYSATGLTEEETQIEEEYGEACSYIPVENWQEKEDCCDQVFYDTLHQCVEDLAIFIEGRCSLPPNWCDGISMPWADCITPWLTGEYGWCTSYTWYTGVFYCGDQASYAYQKCIY